MLLKALPALFLWVLTATPAWGASGVDAEEHLFFNLHQAINLIEQDTHGFCKTNPKMIKDYLINADAELASMVGKAKTASTQKIALEPLLMETWRLFNLNGLLPVSDIELLRFQLHEVGLKRKLKHNEEWYLALANCGIGEKAEAKTSSSSQP